MVSCSTASAAFFWFEPSPSLSYPVVDLGHYVAQYLLFGVIAALILLPAVFGEDGGGLWRRALRHRSLVWLGLVSYGIFLWQFPVLIFLLDAGVETFVPLTLLTFTITVGCAAVSYYLLERPLMRRVRRRRAITEPCRRLSSAPGRVPATFWPSHRCQQEESMRLSVDRDVKRLFDNPVVLPLVVLGMVVVGGILRLVVARQDLFGDELATYWVVSTRGLRGVVETVSTTAEITPPLSFVLSWLTTRLGLSPELVRLPALIAGIAAIPLVYAVGTRTVGRSAALLGRGAHDAQPVHDLLLGRGARLRRAHGAAPPVDPGPAAGHRRRPGGLVGALRPVRLPGRVHALHGGVRAGRPAGVGGLGPPAVAPARC